MIFNALCKEFGNEDMLFVGLWITVESDSYEYDYEEEYDDDESPEEKCHIENKSVSEMNYEERIKEFADYVLNDVTYDKLEAYEWVRDGMW